MICLSTPKSIKFSKWYSMKTDKVRDLPVIYWNYFDITTHFVKTEIIKSSLVTVSIFWVYYRWKLIDLVKIQKTPSIFYKTDFQNIPSQLLISWDDPWMVFDETWLITFSMIFSENHQKDSITWFSHHLSINPEIDQVFPMVFHENWQSQRFHIQRRSN